jgi:malonyl-CoA decarboxylase
VVEDLSRELPKLSTFVTLSPVPGFCRWLRRGEGAARLAQVDPALAARVEAGDWLADEAVAETLKQTLAPIAAHYFLEAKDSKGRPVDPVARFHLGNGARLERLCWLADTSLKGLTESASLMANYLYDLPRVEANHEAFANEGHVAAAAAIRRLIRPTQGQKRTLGQHVG